jgi:hypothetical protein
LPYVFLDPYAAGAAGAVSAFSFFINRDLRRAALFLCKIPLPAALSSALIAARTASASGLFAKMPVSAFLIIVFTRDLYATLRACLRAFVRMRFFADFVFAKVPILPYNLREYYAVYNIIYRT